MQTRVFYSATNLVTVYLTFLHLHLLARSGSLSVLLHWKQSLAWLAAMFTGLP